MVGLEDRLASQEDRLDNQEDFLDSREDSLIVRKIVWLFSTATRYGHRWTTTKPGLIFLMSAATYDLVVSQTMTLPD